MQFARLRYVSLFGLFLLVFVAPSLLAQTSSTGGLTGTVKDTTGAVIPNTTVTATSPATGQTRTATTSADGSYNIGLLQPGTYSVTFTAPGFQTVQAPTVTVTVTETGTLDETLTVGSQTQEVTVQANVETVQTANATVGSTIAGSTVTDLPLASRNYTNLLSLSAGADASVTNAAQLGKGTQAVAVNGSNQQQNNYQMDGASIVSYSGVGGVSEGGSRGAFGIPNPDTIQEFRIQTSQYDAGYGRNPGANVNVITKSGTNDFHGNAFEYFRNTVLNAGDWFAKHDGVTGDATRLLDQNQYGGTFGGPVKKDKLFFFVAYQGTSQKNGLNPAGSISAFLPQLPAGSGATGARGTCPSAATLLTQCSPAAQTFAGNLGALYAGKKNEAFPGVAIAADGSNINLTALKLLQITLPGGAYYIPTPPAGVGVASPGVSCVPVPSPGTSGFPQTSWAGVSSCTSSVPAIYHEYQGMGNWDYVINSKNTLSGRYFYSQDPSIQPFYQSGVTVPGTPENAQFTNHEATLKLTTVLSSNLVNEARASYQRNLVDTSTGQPFLCASCVGMTALNAGVGYDVLPRIDIGPSLNFGTSVFGTTTNHIDQFQWSDQISWSHGKHTIRGGFEVDHDNWNWNFLKGLGAGLLAFISPSDFFLGLPACAPGTFPVTCNAGTPGGTNGTPVGSIIAEPNFATTYASAAGGDFHFWNWSYDGFLQDDIKLTPRLTVNLGVRWEYDGVPSERTGKGVNVNTQFAAAGPVPLTAAPCPGSAAAPAPIVPCPGSSFVGFTVPSNYNASLWGALPAGVLTRSGTTMGDFKSPWDDFAPRVGFAWQPLSTSKFVVRGGFGNFYDLIGGENYIHGVLQSVPYAETVGGNVGAGSLQVPFANPPANWTPRWVTASGLSSNIIQQPLGTPGLPSPLTYQWNLNAQYEFWPSWVLEVGYVGSRGIHQNTGAFPDNPALLQNAAVTGAPPVTGNAFLRVPLLGFAPNLQAYANNEDTKYNGLQTTVRKNFSHGLTLQGSFSWSRALDSSWQGDSAIRGATVNPTWALNPIISQYGLNGQYHPRRFSLNYSYELPFGHRDGWVGVATSGWRVSGETVIQSGAPLNITDGSNLGNIFGGGSNIPTTSQAQYLPGLGNANAATHGSTDSRVLNGWINTAAFCPSNVANPCEAAYAISNGDGFGNAGQGNLLGPGQNNWDISLSKITRVGGLRESATLEFRTEFFDAFNHPQFNNPDNANGAQNNVNITAADPISSLSVNPRLIQFALKYAF